jgi:DNA-binding MarR family transcriptional regulator
MSHDPGNDTSAFSGGSDLPVRLHAALAKLGVALKASSFHEDGPLGLSPLQAQALVLLRLRADAGLRIAEGAALLGITDAAAIELMLALVQKRLVRRHEGAREITFVLTEEGRDRAEGALGLSDALLESIEATSPVEQEHGFRTVVRILRSMLARGRLPIAGMCVTCRHFEPNVHPHAAAPHHCGLVDAPLSDAMLRVDCPEHAPAPSDDAARAWEASTSTRRAPRAT